MRSSSSQSDAHRLALLCFLALQNGLARISPHLRNFGPVPVCPPPKKSNGTIKQVNFISSDSLEWEGVRALVRRYISTSAGAAELEKTAPSTDRAAWLLARRFTSYKMTAR